MKRVDPLDKRMDRVAPAVTPSELLIDNGFDIDSNPSRLPKALAWAARAGHVDVVRLLLARKPQVTRQNGYQDLMEAVVSSGKDETLKLMMDNNVDMNLHSDYGWTALISAVVHGQERMVEMLLSPSSGVIVNQKDTRGSTALHYAAKARTHNDRIIKMLIQSGADVNSLDDEGNSPLYKAAKSGHKAIARLLLNADANIEATDEEGTTPLREAFQYGHANVVQLLLHRGANTRSVSPFTPLYPDTPKEGFEAARKAILWWEEKNKMKLQIGNAIAEATTEPEIPAKRRDIED